MKKIVRASFMYMIMGFFSGVFYREFTKLNDFTGDTQLSVVHTHVLILGMFFFLLVLVLEKLFKLSDHKRYKLFYAVYNSGLGITVLMMLIHGSMTVLGKDVSPAISGIAGLGHILIWVGLCIFFNMLSNKVSQK